MSEEDIMSLLRAIKEQLNSIESRQIKTTAMVEEVEKAEEKQAVGSFASTDK